MNVLLKTVLWIVTVPIAGIGLILLGLWGFSRPQDERFLEYGLERFSNHLRTVDATPTPVPATEDCRFALIDIPLRSQITVICRAVFETGVLAYGRYVYWDDGQLSQSTFSATSKEAL
ncbi:hypothetical protein [Gymnodinialimonas sp.]